MEIKQKPWMNSFGQLRDLHDETLRIDRIIAEEFGGLEPQDDVEANAPPGPTPPLTPPRN